MANAQTGLAQEALLILAAHNSDLLLHPALTDDLHPAALHSLSLLKSFASRYTTLLRFATSLTQLVPPTTLPDAALPITAAIASLGASLKRELASYQSIVIDLEFRLLAHHPSLVPADRNSRPAPPLSAILAEMRDWEPVLDGLEALRASLLASLPDKQARYWTAPDLIELVYKHSLTGSPRLEAIFQRLQASVEQVWIDAFRAFVVYGECPVEDRPTGACQPLDDLFFAHRLRPPGASSADEQPLHVALRPGALPALPALHSRASLHATLAQICRALSILKHLTRPPADGHPANRYRRARRDLAPIDTVALPLKLQTELRRALGGVSGPSHPAFCAAMEAVQASLSNHLFATYLTPELLATTLHTLTAVFLHRDAALSTSLVAAFARFRTTRRTSARRALSVSNRELDVVLLKAALSTDAGGALALDGFRFAVLPPTDAGHTFGKLLSDAHAVVLTYSPPPGLALLLPPETCARYSAVHGCLFALLLARHRLQQAWHALLVHERARSRWVRRAADTALRRLGFETLRRASGWAETMVAHCWQDVVEGAWPVLGGPASVETHTRFLGLVEAGLGVRCTQAAEMMAGLIALAHDLAGTFEGWSFELLPGLLEGGGESEHALLVAQRHAQLLELLRRFEGQMEAFVGGLREPEGNGWKKQEGGGMEEEVFRRKCVDGLVLRLDFNRWFSGRGKGDEGGGERVEEKHMVGG